MRSTGVLLRGRGRAVQHASLPLPPGRVVDPRRSADSSSHTLPSTTSLIVTTLSSAFARTLDRLGDLSTPVLYLPLLAAT